MCIKIGDFVYFSSSKPKMFTNPGMVISIIGDKIYMLNPYRSIYDRDKEDVKPLSDKEEIIKEINDYYDNKIQEYKNQLKSVKRSDYSDEVKSKYYLLKQEILNTAKNMIELDSKDDTEFENKLKAICEKKKNIFSIKCEGMNDARKFNGEIKYNITQFERMRYNDIKQLDDGIEKLKKMLGVTI